MSNYVKTTNFATKDSLPTGDANKIVKGTEIDNEFNAISGAIGSKADTSSPTFTGTPSAPTATAGANTTQLATTAFVKTAIDAVPVGGTIASQNANAVAITGGTITGVNISGITDLAVADGGTGTSSITANSVILGNGSSALSGNLVAPGTSGNLLTSNGTTWQSTTPPDNGINGQVFTTVGTSSWTAPSGVYRVKVFAIGGGQGANNGGAGGSSGLIAQGVYAPGGAQDTTPVGVGGVWNLNSGADNPAFKIGVYGEGASAGALVIGYASVTPGISYTVTVGAAGVGGTVTTQPGMVWLEW